MAFRFGDPGGRGYNVVGTSNVNQLAWWSGAAGTLTSNFSTFATGGRSGGTCIRMAHGNAAQYLSKSFDNQSTWGIAFAIKCTTSFINAGALFVLADSGTQQCDLRYNTDGSLKVTRNGTLLATTSSTLSLNVWTHVEWKTKIDNTVGTTEVRFNGAPVLTYSGNTRNTANNSANQIALGQFTPGVSNSNWDYDDIIIWDGQLNDPQGNPDIHDFIGDCGLVWLLPTGAGTTTQFTPDSGSNYARVNEVTPDGDTSYVEDGTIGHIDTYALANLPANVASVKSLAVASYTRKSDFSARGMKHELRSNSTNFAHANEVLLSDTYAYYMSTWGQNPVGVTTPTPTPAIWTVADVNALEIGRQVSS